jgi:hypothetical protein
VKKLIVTFIFLISCLSIQAQHVKPEVINSMGGSAQYTSGYLAYAVGEPVIGAESGTTVILTQGFLQTWQTVVRQITLKLFIEGLYSGGGMMRESSDFDPVNEIFPPKWDTGIADTVTVELYDDSYANKVAKYPGVRLHMDGKLAIPDLVSSLTGSYYITIFQRNSVPITTATPQSFAGRTISYDFTTPIDQAYGAGLAPQKDLGDGFYGMYAGAMDQANDPDYLIDVTDLNFLEPIINVGPFGYLDADLDGSGFVDVTDLNLLEPNVNFGPRFWNPLLFAKKKHNTINQNK